MDLPTGRLRLQAVGRRGRSQWHEVHYFWPGHPGVSRLRIGIGSTRTNQMTKTDAIVSHVLGRFAPEDRKIVDAVIPMAVDAINFSLRKGVERSMSLYNGREVEL